MRKKLMLSLNYGEHKLPDKPLLRDPDFAEESSSDSQTDTYIDDSIGEIENYLALDDKDQKLSDAWSRIQRKAAAQNRAQDQRLVRNLAVTISWLGPLFLGVYDIKLLRSPIIVYEPDFFIGLQYGAGFFLEQNAIQIHQFRVKEAHLDCLALEICTYKKKSEKHCKQIEDFH